MQHHSGHHSTHIDQSSERILDNYLLKPAIKKQPFKTNHYKNSHFRTIQSRITPPRHSMQDSSQKQSFQEHFTTADVHDIVAMKKAFPKSFDHVGNMPGTYTIHLDPFSTTSSAYKEENANRVQRTNRKSTTTDERPKDHHSSNHTNRMGFINNIP